MSDIIKCSVVEANYEKDKLELEAKERELDDALFPLQKISEDDASVMEKAAASRHKALETHGENWSALPEWLQTDYTNLSKSQDEGLKDFNHFLAENAQGSGGDHSAAVLVRLNTAVIKKAGGNAINRGFDIWRAEQKPPLGFLKGYLNPKYRRNFEHTLAQVVNGSVDPASVGDGIRLAAKGVANQLEVAGKMRAYHKEKGWEDLKFEPNYFPNMLDINAMSKLNLARNEAVDLLAKGYLKTNEAKGMKAVQARAIAYAVYDQSAKGYLSSENALNIMKADTVNDAARLLKEFDVPQNVIDDFVKESNIDDDWMTRSNRTKTSINIDWNSEIITKDGKRVKVADIMDTNTSKIVEAYTNESAFGAAMAEKGIKSAGQLSRIMETLEKVAGKAGRNSEKIQQDVDGLNRMITQLKGRPIVDYKNDFNKRGRMLLDYTAMLRLAQVGFASIPEMARALTELGLSEIIRAVPGSEALRMPNLKGISDIKRRDEMLRSERADTEELEEMIGFLGEADWERSFNLRPDDLGSEMTEGMMGKLEAALEGGRRVGSWLSLHQTIQGGIGKIVSRATSRKLLKNALGTDTLTQSMKNQMKMAGMSEERWAVISDWVKKNSTTGSFQGRDIPLWNHKNMPPDIARDLQVTLSRLINRSVQKANVGEMNTAWLGANARYITQFKTFSLISMEKQLIADMRGDSGAMAGKFIFGAGIAYASYMAQMKLRSLGISDDRERQEYFDRMTSGVTLAMGVINKTPIVAGPSLGLDGLFFTGTAPEEMYDGSRLGYMNANIDAMVPVLGVVNQMGKTAGAVATAVGAPFRDDGDAIQSAKDAIVETSKLVPGTNTIVVGEYIKNLNK